MANPDHVKILKQGVDVWNKWREDNPDVKPDLSEANLNQVELIEADLSKADLSGATLRDANLRLADLSGANLSSADLFEADLVEAILRKALLSKANLSIAQLIEADLRGANLSEADLGGARLCGADLRSVNLSEADLSWSDLIEADLSGADLSEANLGGARLCGADLRDADLSWSDLSESDLREAKLISTDMTRASLVESDMSGAILSRCKVYGISSWDIITDDETKQDSLIITPVGDQEIAVDNLEIAQFLYLILNNKKLGYFFTVMRKKAVLVLGSFGSKESKDRLDGIKRELSSRGYMPIMFTFDTSATSFPTETVRTLALLSNFVVIDLSEQAGQFVELADLVPETFVPFIQIAHDNSHVTWMLKRPYPWVSELIRYSENAISDLPTLMENKILPCAKEINEQLREKRNEMWD